MGPLMIYLLGLYFEDVSVVYLSVVQLPQLVWNWTSGGDRLLGEAAAITSAQEAAVSQAPLSFSFVRCW